MLQPIFTLKVKITFTTAILGSTPKGDVHAEWVASRAPADVDAAAESETAPDLLRGVTGFHRLTTGDRVLYDYVFKGFLKEACSHLRRSNVRRSAKIRAHKQIVDGQIFVTPRTVILTPPAGWSASDVARDAADWENGTFSAENGIAVLSRALRASTPKGDRVALAASELLPAGTTCEPVFAVYGGIELEDLREWLDYGELSGLGQWRSGGWGRFTYKEVSLP